MSLHSRRQKRNNGLIKRQIGTFTIRVTVAQIENQTRYVFHTCTQLMTKKEEL